MEPKCMLHLPSYTKTGEKHKHDSNRMIMISIIKPQYIVMVVYCLAS